MEPAEEIPALRIPPNQIGLIREAPVRRWLHGQAMWDKQFKRRPEKIFEKRKKFEEKAEQIIRHATRNGLVVKTEAGETQIPLEQVGGGRGEQDEARPIAGPQDWHKNSRSTSAPIGIIDENRRFGPLDLDDENPPPSAIARRRDTVSQLLVSTISPADPNPSPIARGIGTAQEMCLSHRTGDAQHGSREENRGCDQSHARPVRQPSQPATAVGVGTTGQGEHYSAPWAQDMGCPR